MSMWAQIILAVSVLAILAIFALKYIELKLKKTFLQEYRKKLDEKTLIFLRHIKSLVQEFGSLNPYQRVKKLGLLLTSFGLKLFAKLSAKFSKFLHIAARKLDYSASSKK